MTKLVRMLFEKIERTDVISNRGPTDKVREGEVNEFILEDEELKKLYFILMQSTRTLERAVLEIRSMVLDSEEKNESALLESVIKEAEGEILKKVSTSECLHMLFWHSLKYEYSQLLGKQCGIRENWQVISNEKSGGQRDLNSIIIGIPRDLAEKIISENAEPGTSGKKPSTFH